MNDRDESLNKGGGEIEQDLLSKSLLQVVRW